MSFVMGESHVSTGTSPVVIFSKCFVRKNKLRHYHFHEAVNCYVKIIVRKSMKMFQDIAGR
jgi:hypothetical protein